MTYNVLNPTHSPTHPLTHSRIG